MIDIVQSAVATETLGLFQGSVVEVGTVQWAQPVTFFIANGVAQVEEQISLPKNALVDDYNVVVQALPPYQVPLSLVAQVRDSEDNGISAFVIDFGSMVSLSGLYLPDPAIISGVKAWTGAAFATQFTYPKVPDQPLDNGASFTEIRTERLLVRYSGSLSADEALEDGVAYLTDPPSGLELRIDGGPPVWTHPAAVRSGTNATLNETTWNDQGKRLVDITAALQALTGDPLAPEAPVTFKLTLSAKLPCLLSLDVQGTPQLRRIRRVSFAGANSTNLVIAEEGRQTLALPLPPPAAGATRRVTEARLTAAGSFPPERTLPPVGPNATLGPSAPGGPANVPVAELVIDPGHAICIRLGGAAGLAELTGVRLPLAVGAGGAELRVTVRDTLAVDPAIEVVSQTSEPLTRDEGAEAWTSFAFKKAYPIDPAALPWLVITAARGEATLAVAAAGSFAGSFSGLVNLAEVRRGPPGGPWQALPAPLTQAPPAGVIAARGRLRLVGLPPKAVPLAPLTLGLVGGGAAAPLTPTAKGVTVAIAPAAPVVAATPTLELTAFAPGNVTLSAIDVVTTE